MIEAYIRLHELGHAHSVEVWHRSRTGRRRVWRGDRRRCLRPSRSSIRVRDASKVALVHLVEHLRERGSRLLDIQQLTPHTARLGAAAIPRAEYLARLAEEPPPRPRDFR